MAILRGREKGGCERFDQWHSMLVGVADGLRHFIVSISFVDPVWMFPCVPCQDVFVLRRDTENTRFCRKVEPTHGSEKLKVTNIPFADTLHTSRPLVAVFGMMESGGALRGLISHSLLWIYLSIYSNHIWTSRRQGSPDDIIVRPTMAFAFFSSF